jgi:hypothetical protein
MLVVFSTHSRRGLRIDSSAGGLEMKPTSSGSRSTRVVLVQAVAALLVGAVTPAFAQSPERAAATLLDAIHLVAADLGDGQGRAGAASVPAAAVAAPSAPAPVTRAAFDVEAPRRPAPLLPLYGTFVVLQGLDAHSTLDAVRRGTAVERNPVLQPFAENAGAVVAIKAATTAGTIFLAEKMWRRHPKRAVVLLTAINVAYAAIVAVNYRR